MDHMEVDATLGEIERVFDEDASAGLSGRGFWQVVAAVKGDSKLAEAFADRIARLDQQGFSRWAMLTIPLGIGTLLAIIGTGVGVALIAVAFSADEPINGVLIVIGMLVLYTTLHSLAHLFVGRIVGIRFTCWFVGAIGRPQPGVKTDYASYLRTPARARAWMHASGAIVTKIVPFAVVPVAAAADAPDWTIVALMAIGVFGLITDSLLSVKTGDWKKFKREMSFAGDK